MNAKTVLWISKQNLKRLFQPMLPHPFAWAALVESAENY